MDSKRRKTRELKADFCSRLCALGYFSYAQNVSPLYTLDTIQFFSPFCKEGLLLYYTTQEEEEGLGHKLNFSKTQFHFFRPTTYELKFIKFSNVSILTVLFFSFKIIEKKMERWNIFKGEV